MTKPPPILATDILDQASLHANMMRVLFGAIKNRDDLGGPETIKDIDYLISLGRYVTNQFIDGYTKTFAEVVEAERDQENRLSSISNHINLVDQKCAATKYQVSANELTNYMAHLKMLVKGDSHE